MSRKPSGEELDIAAGELTARLRDHRVLAGLPPSELAWIIAHGTAERFAAKILVIPHDRPIENLMFVLSGHMAIYVDRGEGQRKALEWRGGDVSGLLPYSRMKSPPGDTYAVEDTDVLSVSRDHFQELVRECPELTARLVHVMLDRARVFTSSDLHDEKMKSLGRLAAGLAHELNNPASAVVRSAKLLSDGLADADAAARELGAAPLTRLQRDAVGALRAACREMEPAGTRTALEAADRVDALTDWLEAHHADAAAAGALAEAGIGPPALDSLAEALTGRMLDLSLRWIARDCANHTLAREIETAASRIHDLVTSIKEFTYMDRETATQPVDVGKDLTNTVMVLTAKVKARSAKVDIVVEPGLPHVLASGGELNQVWLNLIDNALDAVDPGGRVEVSAKDVGGKIVVQVVDDGPGIPDAVLPRIFDPFFTTKPVGKGTGLGLDIVRRLVNRYGGTIEVETRPMRTAFTVTLPAEARAGGGAAKPT